MVQVSYPGVYIQEVPSGARTITGVATAIASFVGMAKRGPINEPTPVLGFTDYVRIFSDDSSQGEMTDQVRQFFLNGGQQAYITRVANGALTAGVGIASNLTLTSRSAGTDANALRASVDYNTSSPERTFNLTIFREVFDAAGNPGIGERETFRDLSLQQENTRYAERIINEESALATLSTDPLTAGTAVSISALMYDSATDLGTAFDNFIAALPSGLGKFTLRIGSVVQVIETADLASLTAAIDAKFPTSGLITVGNTPAAGTRVSLSFTYSGPDDEDIAISPAPDSDLAVAFGLGVAQGGLEIGAYAGERPLANSFVSNVGALGADLYTFADVAKSGVTQVVVTGPKGFTTTATIAYPDLTGDMFDGTVDSVPSLRNVEENLRAIADAINASEQEDWEAAVHGHRLSLVPLFGAANSGPGHTMTGPAQLAATFARRGTPLTGGDNGSVPLPTDYQLAFDTIDSKVDLFNILLLPKSAGNDNRTDVWGKASVFAQNRRAFLIIDAASNVSTVNEAVAEVKSLRLGLVKDHAALYWPRIEVNPDGRRRAIDPSGSIAGTMARIDSNRGVWKAPAGIEADIRGALGVTVPMSDPENGRLNPLAANAIRVFPNGIISWGARTMDGFDNSGNDDFKYVPVRRFTLFIEESLSRGLKFAVFEPNDEPLWAQLRLAVGSFMNNLFRRGAFAGATSREAYFVKVDSETTTQNDINLGIVNVVVGFAPLKPAEFVVVTIKQKAGQVQV